MEQTGEFYPAVGFRNIFLYLNASSVCSAEQTSLTNAVVIYVLVDRVLVVVGVIISFPAELLSSKIKRSIVMKNKPSNETKVFDFAKNSARIEHL